MTWPHFHKTMSGRKRSYYRAFSDGANRVVDFVASLFPAKKRRGKTIAYSEFPPELLDVVLEKFGQEGLDQLALTNREYYEIVREFQRRKGDDRRKYVADIKTFVNIIDDEKKTFKEKFDAICKRIDESKPFNAGKLHEGLVGHDGKVRNVVFKYLSTLDDVTRSDEIYKLLIALASKEELLRPAGQESGYTDEDSSNQIGATCIPANKYPPGSGEIWRYKGIYSFTAFRARVGNPIRTDDGNIPYLDVNARLGHYFLNFVHFPPQENPKTLVDVLKVAREHKCIIMDSDALPYEVLINDQERYTDRVYFLCNAISALAEAFFLCDKNNMYAARIRTAFVDLA